jgi:sortase (surface protein transpeptidase)
MRLARWLFALSALVLIGTSVSLFLTRPRAAVGSVPSLGGNSGARPFRALDPTDGPDSRLGEALLTGIQVLPARLADTRPAPGAMPVRLRIPAIAVDAHIVPVGVAGPAVMQIPRDVTAVGWYRFGSTPGEPGSALLVGHVDSRIQGSGVFFRLSTLGVGSRLAVGFKDAPMRQFEVVARRAYDKGHLPGRLFARNGRPVLMLITCGGAFDRVTHRYSDNIVVYAVPHSAP